MMRAASMVAPFVLWVAVAGADQRWSPEKPDTLQVKGGVTSPGLDFAIRTSGPGATYVPNSVAAHYLALSYNRLGLSVQMPTDPDDESVRLQGKSKIEDYQLRFFGHRSTWEIIYQNFQGYSLQDWSQNNEPIIRSDIAVESFSLNYIRALSPRHYSLAVAFDQKGRQENFGQSWFLWSSFVHNHVTADEPLIPSFVTEGRTDLANLTELKANTLLAGIGYGFQWPFWNRAYLTLAPFFGLGLSDVETLAAQREREQLNATHRMGARLGGGYNGDRHFAGFHIIADSNNLAILGGTFTQSTINARVFYGYRFEDVNLHWIKWVRNQLPLPEDSVE